MASTSNGIRILCAGGSVRPGNQTAKALAYVADEIGLRDDVTVEVIDPAQLSMPLPGTARDGLARSTMEALQEKVTAATGVVLATPEYHGSYSSVIKLFIEQLGYPSVLSGKPVALLGVAAGAIGAIQIAGTPSQRLFARRSDCVAGAGVDRPCPQSIR